MSFSDIHQDQHELLEEIKKLKAENAQYREALGWIVSNQHLIVLADNETHAEHFTAKAREALKEIK